MDGNLAQLSPLELASGLCFGEVEAHLPRAAKAETPLRALEEAIRPALDRPPCLVAFSGGRDSSVVLAAAMSAARRFGLEPPVAATLRFPHAPETYEADWQETVISHLGTPDWVRIEMGEELEYLGPIGTAAVRRHGPLWPPNAYLVVPLLERAAGGSVVTGDGGDEFLTGGAHARIRAVASRRLAPERRDLRRALAALAPRPLRLAAATRRSRFRIPWLRPAARRRALVAAIRDLEGEPVGFQPRVHWLARRRATVKALWTGQRLAADTGARLVAPLSDPGFLAALAAAGGWWGWSSRDEVMRALFGEVLPDAVLARRTKAGFAEILWGPSTRAFAAAWSGQGLDPELVDPASLRAAWTEPSPTFPAGIPLQAAWLASQ